MLSEQAIVLLILAPEGQSQALSEQLANTVIGQVIAVESSDFAKHGQACLLDAITQVVEKVSLMQS